MNRSEAHVPSSNTLITGGTFVFQTNTYPTTGAERRKGMRKLGKMIAQGASHNSAERYDPPKCHPETRKAVLRKIMDWIQGLEDSQRRCYFMWLYGPAGAGKSAIAQTIAELCHELNLLAASFFFSRTAAGRNDHSCIIATLSYQLCLSIPEIRTYVEDAVELDPNIFSLSIENQLQTLILNPLIYFHENLSRYHGRIHPMLVIIDGLDECASTNYLQSYVLQVLAEKLPIPMLFLVASRPEPHIRGFFTAEPMASITTTLALDDSYQPDTDIKVFLKAKFDAIKRDHPLRRKLPGSWPSTADIDYLVHKSSGQFIYASTVMKYVDSPRHWPTDRLQIIFGIMDGGGDIPFVALDALYTCIFSSVKDINKVLKIFSVLLFVNAKTTRNSPRLIEDLLALRRGDLDIALIDLHSILDIPALDNAGEIRILHTSLGDFLLDQTRSGNYHINQGHAHAHLTQCFMRNIPQKVTGNNDISGLHGLSSVIFTVHCSQSYPTAELLNALWSFNVSAFWTLCFSESWSRASERDTTSISRASLLSDFFTWLKDNGSSKQGRDLYSHYISTWDQYMRHSLSQLSPGPLETQSIVFSMLKSIHNHSPVYHIFTPTTFGAGYEPLSDISSILKLHAGDHKYDLLLTEFFEDPSRSGPFCLDGDKYANLAVTFTKYLLWDWLRFEWGLSCLSIILSKASYSKELATLLNSQLLNMNEVRRLDLVQAAADIINAYCNNASRGPDRPANWSRSRNKKPQPFTNTPMPVTDDPLDKVLRPPPNETPEHRQLRLASEAEAKRISMAIDDIIKAERQARRKKRIVKLLLLGQSEAGKSTTLKQFQRLYMPTAFREERILWRAVIQLNIVRSIRTILEALSSHPTSNSPYSSPELRARSISQVQPSKASVTDSPLQPINIDAMGNHPPSPPRHNRLSYPDLELESDIELTVANDSLDYNNSPQSDPMSSTATLATTPLDALKARFLPLWHIEDLLIAKLVPPNEDKATDLASPSICQDGGCGHSSHTGNDHTVKNYGRGHAPSQFHYDQEIFVRPGTGWKSALARARVNFTEYPSSGCGSSSPSSGYGHGHAQRPTSAGNTGLETPDEPQEVIYSCRKDMIQLWNDRGIREILRKKKIRLEDASGFFLDDLERVTSLEYIPSDDDVLKARLKTVGVSEYKLTMEVSAGRNSGTEWRIVDVGGSRSQRPTWVPFFDDVDAIIFLAPTSGFDQALSEDRTINRLEDSVLLWKAVCANKLLANVHLILFLNKCDLLEKKLNSGIRFVTYVRSYGDRVNDLDTVCKYLRAKFGAIHREYSPNPRKFYAFCTSVTDNAVIGTLITNVRDMVIRQYLQQSALL